jgi:general secretion pathway protein B
MSYILDALRKSDQQRRRGAVPSLPTLPPALLARERPALLPYALLGLSAVVVVGMALAWLRPWSQQVVQAPRQLAAAPVDLPLRPVPPVVATARLAVAVTENASRPATPSPAAVTPPLRRPPAIPAPRARAAAPTVAIDGSADRPAAEPATLAKPMAMAELPPSIRRQLPPLQVAVHAYSGTAHDRLVSINGRMLREGELLAPDLRLEQITPEGMVFAFRGYRFRREAQ